jgi:hypothetical protein
MVTCGSLRRSESKKPRLSRGGQMGHPRMHLQKRNSFDGEQPDIGRNQRELEDFGRSGEKGVGGVSMRKMNLGHGENDFDGQGRFDWGGIP